MIGLSASTLECSQITKPPNEQAQQRQGLGELHIWKSAHAPAVCCSALIIIMASLGWAGNPSQGYKGLGAEASAQRGIFRKDRALPTTMRAQAPTPLARRPRSAPT